MVTDALLAIIVRLLPARHRDWGLAMRAETAALPSGPRRWAHAVGCAGAVLAQPAALRAVGYPLAALAALGAVVRWSAGIGHGPLRWAVVGAIALLLAVASVGRFLAPVDAGAAARAVRAGGCLLVGAMTAMFAAAADGHGPPGEQARTGVPILAVLLAGYLAGVLVLTADRTALSARALLTGVAVSVAAAGMWLAAQLAFPPLPPHAGGAIVAVGCGAAAVALLRPGPARDTGLAACCVGMLAPLLVFAGVVAMSVYGPAWLIPDLVPAALTPADRLANSRIEIQDPYMTMLLLAGLAAVAVTVAGLAPTSPAEGHCVTDAAAGGAPPARGTGGPARPGG
ncbi:hypothetical protein Daura_27140 [Dactylosporangium aurantiacum]|uniref:Integral membrane protein n=1 Tax=Dactylosporangium aurantiacum TaxID=35754 RepID=A0A9Q9I736_9ACTN|nr:hypothetical protein [Dactylosporangium aurantiacum]MDG6106458.1 hypothetical protein [Dactylosporangium aurantiacum]UWZ50507.1 hypothetical protein Daura_27140 [Dactylosporangium aurantiacum]